MGKHSSPMMQLTRRGAAFRLRQPLGEFHVLMSAFPDLHDAFDPDELPLAFTLWRDSRLADGRAPSTPFSPTPQPRGSPPNEVAPQGKARSS